MKVRSIVQILLLQSLALVLAMTVQANDYFVDAGSGSDSNAGSSASPWKTLGKARNSAPAGSTVFVKNGNYGNYAEGGTTSSNAYLTFKAAAGHTPTLSGLSLAYASLSSAYLRFEGFDIHATSRMDVVYLQNARHVQLVGNTIRHDRWAINNAGVDAVYILDSADILIARNRIRGVHRGISASRTARLTVRRNYITPSAGTGIQYAGGNSNGLIEYNHLQGAGYQGYPSNPDAVKDPHASMISVRSGNLTIRNNVMHGMGSSSGVMFYEPDVAGGEAAYSNILFENNAIYDVGNTFVLRIYNLGSNFVVRNNLLFSRIRTGDCNGYTPDARYRYSNSLVVHNTAAGHSGDGLELSNNIMIGIVGAPQNARERNNVIWSWGTAPWLAQSPSGTSMIVTSAYGGCGTYARFFESEFFANPIDFKMPGTDPFDLTLAANSPAVGFGDPSVQAPESLGSIGADGFMVDDGILRTNAIHSVGPYEFGAGGAFPKPDILPE
jgi:hypothetical protein